MHLFLTEVEENTYYKVPYAEQNELYRKLPKSLSKIFTLSYLSKTGKFEQNAVRNDKNN